MTRRPVTHPVIAAVEVVFVVAMLAALVWLVVHATNATAVVG